MYIVIPTMLFCLIIIAFFPFNKVITNRNFHKLIRNLSGEKQESKKVNNKKYATLFNIFEKVYSICPVKLNEKTYEKYRNKFVLAGISESITVESFMGLKIVLALFFFLYILFFMLISSSEIFIILMLIAPTLGFFYPNSFLKSKISKRKWQIQVELPNVLNTLAIITEAGLSFLEAIKKVCEVREGVLISELKKMLDEINIGILQKEALFRLSERCQVNDVSILVATLSQSLQKGSSGVTVVLKEQAKGVWEKRKNKAKELGEKASMKLFLPMLLLVFPCLLIFMLGPAIIQAIKLLAG